jgi:hypothetical protein
MSTLFSSVFIVAMFSLAKQVLQNFDPQPPTKEVPNQRSSIAGFLAIFAVPVFLFYFARYASFSAVYYPIDVICICANKITANNSWIVPNPSYGDLEKLLKM